METIISYTMMNIALNFLSHLEQIKNLTEPFLTGVSHACLVSSDLSLWNDFDPAVPLINRDMESNATIPMPIPAYIIDAYNSNWNTELMKPLNRSSLTKHFVIVKNENYKSVTQDLLLLGWCNVMIATVASGKIELSKLVDPCRGIGIEPHASETKNSHCRGNISFMDFPPHVIFQSGRLTGFEGVMIQTLVDNLGFNVTYVNRHEAFWGKFEPPSGLQGDVKTTSMLGVGALYPFESRSIFAEVLVGCSPTELSWAVPVGAGKTEPTWYINLVSEFSPTVWILTFVVYLGFLPVSLLFGGKQINSPFHILALILGVPQELHMKKTLTLKIVFFGFMVTTHYQSMMSSKLTRPAKIPEITTLKELSESGLRIQGPPVVKYILEDSASTYPEDTSKSDLSARFEGVNDDVKVVLPKIVQDRRISFVRQASHLNYRAEQNPITARQIHIVEEAQISFLPIILMTKHSCLTEIIKRGVIRLCDSGLGSKWLSDWMMKHSTPVSKAPQRLAMTHLEGVLYLLAAGWALVVITFFGELLVFYYHEKMRSMAKKKAKHQG